MTDFNSICYHAVTEFLILENVLSQQIHNRMTVVYGEGVPSYATGLPSSIEAEKALKIGQDVHPKLTAKKIVVLWKLLFCKIVEERA